MALLCYDIISSCGELRGHSTLHVNSGPPQTVEYRIDKLVHNPKIALAGMTERQLINATMN